MFERYDENARRSLFYARYEASQLGSRSIESEHLLLGLLRLGENPASRILARLPDIRTPLVESARDKEKISTSVEIPFSKSAKRALEVAAQEADRLHHSHIGPEHLLLALLADRTTVAGELLATHGLDHDTVHKDIASGRHVARPGAVLFPAAESGGRQQAMLQQLEAARVFISGLNDECHTAEAQRLIDRICRDIDALKAHL
jgi:ATP-dependent Clp protease ATP-binding subunit ClpC